jgi:DNA-binding transcriptional MerR regulator
MRIGQLARSSGISTDTIRYYEKIGLLPRPPRTESGYREYAPGVVNRIRVIRNAAQLGFPLHEIAKVLRVRDAGGAPCRQVRDYAASLVDRMQQRIEELTVERQAMLTMIRVWDRKLARAHGAPANLLEAVPAVRPRWSESRLRSSRPSRS